MLHKLLLSLVLAVSTVLPSVASAQDAAKRVPTVDDLLNLKSAGSPQVSPDGKWVAYTVTSTDWKQDAFVTQIWVAQVASGRTFQLTRGEKSCSGPTWSPDSAWIAFSSARVGDKTQVFAIRPDGGEAVQLTNAENGTGGYAWSLDGKQIAYTASDVKEKDVKARKDYLGDFEVVRKEYGYRHLWTFTVADALAAPVTGTERTKGKDYSVSSFSWSPDSRRIAFSATINPDLIQGGTADIYVLDLATNAVRKVVDFPGPDNGPEWSPDGRSLVFSSAMGNPKYFYSNNRLAVVAVDGGKPRSITDAFDEQPRLIKWAADGVYFGALQKTASHLFRVDPATGAITRISQPDTLILGGGTLTADGKTFAFVASSPTSTSEIYLSPVQPFAPRRLTSMSDQVGAYTLGRREVISWRSRDGTPIEGVLIKPADFEAGRRYPLLCIIHGGPTGVDQPTMIDTRVYPSDLWAARGALILKVNYRGSAGYGEKFRQLNVRNLGVGDAWDVLSGVDHLVKLGWVDPKRVGCMGWSQGGYISAFLTTSSTAFAAISVGAGISDWATYYYNTDITPFTIQYLGADPATDPEIYAKTSPMTYIKQASTPTLIQHGELDRRVPIPNAYELRQGLEDRGVKVEMVVYKGFGHGVSKPKASRAVMQHNLSWFDHYIFGDPLPDFAAPELPKSSPDVSLSRLSDSVWVHTSYQTLNGTPMPANGLVVRARDGSAILVDTAWDDEDTRQLLRLIEQQVGGAVKLAFVTHAHDDRIGGIRALLAASVRVVSGNATRDFAVKRGLPAPEAAARNPEVFDVGGTKAELFYPGAGHAADNTVVWFPEAKVLFGGCLVREMSATTRGYVAEADLTAWPRTVDAVMRRYPLAVHVVPGHGQPGGRELLEHTLRLVSSGT